jgi:hypothetical protein
MERDFNALMHTIITTLQAVTERHGEDAVVPLLTSCRRSSLPSQGGR